MRRFERSHPDDEVWEAVPMDAGYEVRECGQCLEGYVYESLVPTGRWIPCPACKGAGKRSMYVYPKKGRRS